MKKFFNLEVDTLKMSKEELEKARKEILDILKSIDYQLILRKMAERKHSS